MDIKLKSFSRNRFVTGTAFLLCVTFFLGCLAGGMYIFTEAWGSSYGNGVDDLLLYDSYEESAVFQREFNERLSNILYLLDEFKSEEYIKSGKTISEDRMDSELRSYFYGASDYSYRQTENSDITNGYESTGVTMMVDGSAAVENNDGSYTVTFDGNPSERYKGDYDDLNVRAQFLHDYADQIAALKQNLITDDLRSFAALQKELNKIKGFVYYATDGTYTVTNEAGLAELGKAAGEKNTSGTAVSAEPFQKAPAYLIYIDDDLNKKPVSDRDHNSSTNNIDKLLERQLDDHYNPKLAVYFSFDDAFLKERETEFQSAKAAIVEWIPTTAACGVVSLLCLIYLIATAGKKDENGNYRIRRIDRIFTELQLLIIGILLVGGGGLFGKFLWETVNYGISIDNDIYVSSDPLYFNMAMGALVGLVSAVIGLIFILSVVRNLKAGRFLKNSLLYIILSAIWKGIKEFYFGGSVMKKVVLITLGVCLLSATVILAPVTAGLILVFAPKWVKKYEAIRKGVDEVRKGNLSYKIDAAGDSELDQLARGINEISEASSIAIQNELKNQRLKTDLISNVSHDLKTPLTSIITYVDLLKQEGLDSPDAPKYLEILDQKSIRLKKLTEDLFDAAKASSGAIPVRFERVDMLSLINQGLGEMGDRIEASGLEFKVNAQKEKYYVRADGQLLWRVVENLLGNVLKYAQEGSRVYIDLMEQNGKNGTAASVVMEIKNISRSELNIDADELMERFKRGDESRATEGSGLGLAIAKDLVRLQNGWFEIKIDGDLFKAIVILNAYAGDPGQKTQEQEADA